MKKILIFFTLLVFSGDPLSFAAGSHDQGSATDHSEHVGAMIHESDIEGYRFAYHLIDMSKNPKMMEGMKGTKDADKTHHLMVYVKDPQGRSVDGAKLGYLVEGPDGAKQKLMTMGMQGAYGANVNFNDKGMYTIKAKFLAGDKKLFDQFSYEVK